MDLVLINHTLVIDQQDEKKVLVFIKFVVFVNSINYQNFYMQPNKEVQKLRQKKNKILERYNDNENLNKEDAEFIKSLLLYHYKKNFVRDINFLYPKRYKIFNQNYISCIAEMKSEWIINLKLEDCFNKIKNPDFNAERFNLQQAFRESVNSQILDFKKKHKTDTQKNNVDHIKPFHKLVAEFLEKKDLSYSNVSFYYDTEKNCYKLTDEKLKNDFQNFHKNNAQLQMISKEENLQKVEEDKKV